MRVFDPNDILINVVPGGIVIFTFLYLTGNIEHVTTSTSVLLIGLFLVVSFIMIEASTKISDQPSWFPHLFTSAVILSRDPTEAEQEPTQGLTLVDKIPDSKRWIVLI
jgi:hypothetical protein